MMEVNGTIRRDLAEEIVRQLLDLGVRMTAPRRTIIGVIAEQEESFTAEELLEAARREDGLIALPTIYRTLSLLEANGIIRKNGFGEERQSYVVGTGGRTQAVLVCEECGKRIVLEDPCLDIRQRYLLRRMGYEPVEIQLQVRARCRSHGVSEPCGHEG